MRFVSLLSILLSSCASGGPVSVEPDASTPIDATRCADRPACVTASCEHVGYSCGVYYDEGGEPIDCGTCSGASLCSTGHRCIIERDAREDNDTPARATWLGDLDDIVDPFVSIDSLSIDTLDDEDWFQFHVTDGLDGGNPRIAIDLRVAAPHELTAWFACDDAEAGTAIGCATSQNTLVDAAFGVGCSTDGTWAAIVPYCAGIADGGTVTLRVRKRSLPRGDLYDLRVGVK